MSARLLWPRAKRSAIARAIFSAIVFLVASLSGLAAAQAHSVGISRGDYRVVGAQITATIGFARAELALGLPELEAAEGNAGLDEATTRAVQTWILARLRMVADGRACEGQAKRVEQSENDGITVSLVFDCAHPPVLLDTEADFVGSLSSGHRHLAHFSFGRASTDVIAVRGQSSLRVTIPGESDSPATTGMGSQFRAFFTMGIEHILTGYDHLLFLFGLLLVLGPIRSLIGAITAFTLAHSLTLGLAVLGVASPSPRLIEPLIALSIAYVGIENWFVRDAVGRWRVTFVFGLIHGFGFAGALREIALPRSQIPMVLFSFNLGVEAGQMAVVAVVLPLLLLASRRGWLAVFRAKVLSLPLAATGLVWFVVRLVG